MIPKSIAMQLKDLLPKEGLLPFLKQYPQYFDVTMTGKMNRKNKPMYTFSMRPSINEAAAQPAVGGVASPSAAPAVGGSSNSGANAASPAASAPAVGGSSSGFTSSSGLPPGGATNFLQGPMAQWSVSDMVQYLESISLGHLGHIIRENGLDGRFFLQCSQDDLSAVGIGSLQWKKIMKYVPE